MRTLVNATGVLGLFLFAAGVIESSKFLITGLSFMGLAYLLELPKHWQTLCKRRVFWAAMGFIAFIVVRASLAYLDHPERLDSILKWSLVYIGVSGLPSIVIARWMDGNEKRVLWTLAIALFYLLLAIVDHTSLEDFRRYMEGQRAMFGLDGNGPGLYAATGILGLLTVGFSQLIRTRESSTVFTRSAVSALILIGFCILSLAFIWNQSRSAWLAATIVIPLVLLLVTRSCSAGHGRVGKHTTYALLLLSLGLILITLYVGSKFVETRFANEQEVIEAIVSNDLEGLPVSPISNRIYLWQAGIQGFMEKPIFGWGPGMARTLTQHNKSIAKFPHLHNLYLHLAVEIGLVGLLLLGLTLGLALRSAWRSYRADAMPCPIFHFSAGSLALFLIASFATIRIDDRDGIFFAILMGALFLSYGFYPQQANDNA